MGKKCVLACVGILASLWLVGCSGGSAPLSVSVTATSSTIDGSVDSSHQNTTTLTATVPNDKNAAGVSWTTSAGTLSSSTTTSSTLAAPAPTSSAQSITVTATSIADPTKTGTATITIPATPSVTNLTSGQQAVAVGTAYTATLTGSGGISPYKNWVLASSSSPLPPCLSLSSAGVLSSPSTPTAACVGVYSGIKFTMTDSGSPNALTATSSAQTITVTGPTLTFPASLASGTVGSAYSASAAASGVLGTATYSITGGSLPASGDLTLNPATGLISGTPKAVDIGASIIKVTVVDQFGDTATSGNLGITIAAAAAITFGAAPTGTATFNVAYSSAVAATGGAGALTYAKASGSLPPDLTLASNGALTGTPKAADIGTWTFAVTASDAFGDSVTSGNFAIVISYPQLTVTTSSLPSGYGNASYSQTLAASGGAGTGYNWTVTSGASSLTALNLSLSSVGVLSGTPPVAGGSASFTVQVTDSASNTTTANLSVTINPGVTITSGTTLPAGYGNTAYSQSLAASGGSNTGYNWTVTSGASSLTALNLTLSSAGVLTGTPPLAGGSATFGVQVTDSVSNTATATFSLTINAGVTVTAPSLSAAYPGAAYASSAFSASGGSNTNFAWTIAAASGSSVPSGFSIGSTTGIIPAASPVNAGSTNATYNVVITATDSLGNKGSANATITIEPSVSITTAATLPGGTANIAYSQQLAASGGSGTGYTWSTDGAGTSSLAALNLSLSAGGLVSGTPTSTGTATFTATVTDSQTHTAQVTFSLTVYNALTITTISLPAGNSGASYSQTLNAGGGTGSGYTWTTTTSNLATYGLSLSNAGAITGSPTQAGTASFTAKVTDSGSNTATQALTITIYSALSLPSPNPVSLPSTGYAGVAYSGTLIGSGGSGSLAISVVSGLPSDSLSGSPAGATLTVSGTPGSAATVTFSAKLTDTTTGNSITQTGYNITISTPTAVTLPAPNPSSLPSATVNQSYNGAIDVSGGVAPYTWSINGTTVGGGGLSLGNGTLSASSTGGTSLTISGNPSTAGTVTLTNVKVVDSLSTNATNTYSITVNSAGQQVSGQIFLNTNCGGGGGNQPPFTVSIDYPTAGSPTTTTTDTNGNYSFSNIPNGSYTVTPSISGASSVFYPATQAVTINNSDVTGKNFQAQVAYSVSGTVHYSGSQTKRVYLTLNSTTCGGNGSQPGTSITSPGNFTIQGVPAGSYTLAAFMDVQGYGAPNENNPSGTTPLTVSTSNVTGASVTITDASAVTLSSGPTIQQVSPADQAVAIPYKPILDSNNNNMEMATSYTVQWSTSSSFSTIAGSKTFPANGDGTDVWIVTGLANSQIYYFRANGTAGSSTSPWTVYMQSGTPVPVTIGAPTTGSTITGTVTFTGAANGPLMVGFYSDSSGVYTAVIQNPVSPQAFTVHVPNGSGYFQFGIIDNNNNGIVDSGDITNTGDGGSSTNSVTISGNAIINLTLPSAASTAQVSTQYWNQTTAGGTYNSYSVNFDIRQGNKQPVAVQLTSGPNVIHPVDIAACSDCGSPQFRYYTGLTGATPSVGDAYVFHVTYADGSSENLTANVIGWNGTSSVVNSSDLVTNMLPAVSGTTTPTFSWTDPASASSFTYQFNLSDNNGNQIWQIPSKNSKLNGFSSSITSITWGTDPTGSGNPPSVGSLTHSTTYNWQLSVQDSNGNQAQSQMYFVP